MTKIYESDNHILIRAEYANPILHNHMAAHIIVTFGDSMTVNSTGTEIHCKGVVIPSDMPHCVNTNNMPSLVFMFDCTTFVAKQINSLQILPDKCCETILELYRNFENRSITYLVFKSCVLDCLGIEETAIGVTDKRIISAIKYIQCNISEKVTCRQVADYVCLSQGRFSHLFKKQVGMTFAAYLVYQRIMYVYSEIFKGRNITESAIEAGFSSSAHFADVNRRIFGLSASSVNNNITFTKAE